MKVLTKHYGFSIERQNGSHIQLKNPDGRRLTVPRHDSKVCAMKSIIEQPKHTRRVSKISKINYFNYYPRYLSPLI
ncbi:MAG TPA: type II toxin-antitoxin system HicA family toxin [Nitrososphaeraceae archaeon]|nr:type II toxin-antitoxin system HicA family toxin [Nitrososphaeraceae archaeon]